MTFLLAVILSASFFALAYFEPSILGAFAGPSNWEHRTELAISNGQRDVSYEVVFENYKPANCAAGIKIEKTANTQSSEIQFKTENEVYEGEALRDYIYVDDVCEGIVRALQSNYSGVLNLGTGIRTKVQELAQIIAELTNTKLKVSKDAKYYNLSTDSIVLDTKRLEKYGRKSRGLQNRPLLFVLDIRTLASKNRGGWY